MSEEVKQVDLAKQRVVYSIRGVDKVVVQRELEFEGSDSGPLTFDLYRPPDSSGTALPAVVFVSGYPDPGLEAMLGCRFKEMGQYVSWGELSAASGLAAITYTNREPVADLQALLRHVREHAGSLGVDGSRLALWAGSGNVPNALSALMTDGDFRCAVLCYGFMQDSGEAAKAFGFANPFAGRSVDDLPRDLPLFIARAGRDEIPGLNETIDRFMSEALAQNLPVTFVNHASAPHAFDVMDDSETSRAIIQQILAFMQFQLLQ